MKLLGVVTVGLAVGASATSHVKVDVHTHFLPDFYAEAMREAGHVPGPDGMPSIPVRSEHQSLYACVPLPMIRLGLVSQRSLKVYGSAKHCQGVSVNLQSGGVS